MILILSILGWMCILSALPVVYLDRRKFRKN
jgi:hypothetical protein